MSLPQYFVLIALLIATWLCLLAIWRQLKLGAGSAGKLEDMERRITEGLEEESEQEVYDPPKVT